MTEIKLPDMQKVEDLIDEINTMGLKEARLTTELKLAEADTVRELSKKYVNNKPLSMDFIKNAYLFTGIDNSLVEKRKELAETTALLESKKNILKFYYVVIDIWRTESANIRSI
jgi:hypothetical protein